MWPPRIQQRWSEVVTERDGPHIARPLGDPEVRARNDAPILFHMLRIPQLPDPGSETFSCGDVPGHENSCTILVGAFPLSVRLKERLV